MFFTFFKWYKWYQIAQRITSLTDIKTFASNQILRTYAVVLAFSVIFYFKGTTIPNLDVINRLRKERDQLQKQLQNFENELSKVK